MYSESWGTHKISGSSRVAHYFPRGHCLLANLSIVINYFIVGRCAQALNHLCQITRETLLSRYYLVVQVHVARPLCAMHALSPPSPLTTAGHCVKALSHGCTVRGSLARWQCAVSHRCCYDHPPTRRTFNH